MRRILILQEPGSGSVAALSDTLLTALREAGGHVTALDWRHSSWPGLIQATKQHDVLLATHHFGPTACAARLKALTGKPVVSWVHGPLPEELKTKGASVLSRLGWRLVYAQVDHFVSVSRTTENALLGFVNPRSRQQRSHVIPNALPPLPEGQPMHVHAGHGGESGIPPLLVGHVGRLSEEKRPRLALETLRFLPEEAQLAIVGDGPLHRPLAHEGMDLLMQGRLHFLGAHPRGSSLYTPWEITLLTSRYEGCAMTALESLACGVPCVSLPIAAMRELYDLDAPYLLARGDAPVALAEAVMTVLSLPPDQVQSDMARIVARHQVPAFAQAWQEVLSAC